MEIRSIIPLYPCESVAKNPLPDYGAVVFVGGIHFAYQSR
jgi:hypothetical protein